MIAGACADLYTEDLLLLFVRQVVWIPALVGLGFGLRAAFGDRSSGEPRNAGELGMLGVVALGSVALVANFLVPIFPWVSTLALVGGLTLLAGFRRQLEPAEWIRFAVVVTALAAVQSAVGATERPVFDTGLYHLPSLRWIEREALPLGLANVDPLLGYNSIWFLALAAAGIPVIGGTSAAFGLNASVSTLFLAAVFSSIATREKGWRAAPLSSVLGLGIFVFANLICNLSGQLSPNVPAILCSLYAWFWLVRDTEAGRSISPLTLLFALFGAAAKVFAAPVVVVTTVLYALSGGSPRADRRVLAATFAVGVAWVLRGLLTSGCLLYPAVASCIPDLTWSVPEALVAGVRRNIAVTNGDLSAEVHAFGAAVALARRARGILVMPVTAKILGAVAVCLFLGLLGRLRGLAPAFPLPRWRIVALIAAQAALVAWWFALSSKTPVFGAHAWLGFGMMLAALGLYRSPIPDFASRRLAVGGLAVALVMMTRTAFLTSSAGIHWVRYPEIPKVPYREDTIGGTRVSIPLEGYRCWDSPLPCVHPPPTSFRESATAWRARRFEAVP